MNKIISRAASAVLAAAMLLSLASTAMAAGLTDKEWRNLPTDESCTIDVSNKKLTITTSTATPKTYNLYSGDIDLYVDTNGLVLSYRTGMYNTYKTVTLGKNIKEFGITGTYASLALTDTLDYKYTANIDATINDFSVSGAMKVVFSDNSVINRLGIYNKDADVFLGSGTNVTESNNTVASATQLEVKIRDYGNYSTGTAYDADSKTVYLNAKASGTTVKQALSDVIISVQRSDKFESIYGTWIWPNINGSSTESGRYTYHFIPYDNNYQSQTLYVEFKSAE